MNVLFKKAVWIGLSVMLIFGSLPTVFGAENPPDVENYSGYIEIYGMTESYSPVTVTVKSSDEAGDKENILYAVKETESNFFGEYSLKFTLRDRAAALPEARYALEVVTAETLYTIPILVLSSAGQQSFKSELQSKNKDSLSTALTSDTSFSEKAKSIGFNLDGFLGLTSSQRTAACDAFYKDASFAQDSVGSLADNFNVNLVVINLLAAQTQNGFSDILDGMRQKNPLLNAGTDARQSFIISELFTKKSFDTGSAFLKQTGVLGALYDFNNAKYSEMSNLFTQHETALELSSNAAYIQYTKSSKKTAIHDALAAILFSSPAKTRGDFIKALEGAVAAGDKVTDSSGQKGTGSAPSGSGSSTSITLPALPKSDNNISSSVDKEALPFLDLNQAEWAKESIIALYEKGIVSGIGDNIFDVSRAVTREEITKMLAGAFLSVDSGATCEFSDTKTGDWHYAYIAAAYQNGIITGIGNGLFGVGEVVTREDAAVMLGRILNPDASFEINNPFLDNESISDYAKPYVYYLCEVGIINGYDGNLFKPKASLTRAECAKLIFAAMR